MQLNHVIRLFNPTVSRETIIFKYLCYLKVLLLFIKLLGFVNYKTKTNTCRSVKKLTIVYNYLKRLYPIEYVSRETLITIYILKYHCASYKNIKISYFIYLLLSVLIFIVKFIIIQCFT